jgi:hypothetical protein
MPLCALSLCCATRRRRARKHTRQELILEYCPELIQKHVNKNGDKYKAGTVKSYRNIFSSESNRGVIQVWYRDRIATRREKSHGVQSVSFRNIEQSIKQAGSLTHAIPLGMSEDAAQLAVIIAQSFDAIISPAR